MQYTVETSDIKGTRCWFPSPLSGTLISFLLDYVGDTLLLAWQLAYWQGQRLLDTYAVAQTVAPQLQRDAPQPRRVAHHCSSCTPWGPLSTPCCVTIVVSRKTTRKAHLKRQLLNQNCCVIAEEWHVFPDFRIAVWGTLLLTTMGPMW